MRKVKKINGYLVVKFNDRARKEWEGLGAYGVIDAELYTGILEVDRGIMEYDDAETLDIAVEQARGLESELDVEEPTVTITVIKETDEATTEQEPVDPEMLFRGERAKLERQIVSPRWPDVDPRAAAYALYGYADALRDLGMVDDGDERFFVTMDTFAEVQAAEERTTFKNLEPDAKNGIMTRKVYNLGQLLEAECPADDCRVYLNIFRMAKSLDDALNGFDASSYPAQVLRRDLRQQLAELRHMYLENYAVQKFKQGLEP